MSPDVVQPTMSAAELVRQGNQFSVPVEVHSETTGNPALWRHSIGAVKGEQEVVSQYRLFDNLPFPRRSLVSYRPFRAQVTPAELHALPEAVRGVLGIAGTGNRPVVHDFVQFASRDEAVDAARLASAELHGWALANVGADRANTPFLAVVEGADGHAYLGLPVFDVPGVGQRFLAPGDLDGIRAMTYERRPWVTGLEAAFHNVDFRGSTPDALTTMSHVGDTALKYLKGVS